MARDGGEIVGEKGKKPSTKSELSKFERNTRTNYDNDRIDISCTAKRLG